MYLQEKRIEYYSELLGKHRPDIQLKLEAFKRFPKLADRIEAELFLMLKFEGFDLIDFPVFPGPSPEDLNKEGIHIGYFIEKGSSGQDFRISYDTIDGKHALIGGKSGSGKSCDAKILFIGLTELGIPVLHLDHENEAADLVKILGPERVMLLNPLDLKIPLFFPPPNCSPEEFYGDKKNDLRERFYLRDGSSNLLDEHMEYLADKGNPLPEVKDLINLINKWKTSPTSRERGYLETLENRFRTLVNGPFDGRLAHPLEKILETSTVIELGKITDRQSLLFFVSHLFSWFMRYRECNPHKGPANVIILEESHIYFQRAAEQRSDLNEPGLIRASRQSRKRDFVLVFVDQAPHLLPPQVLANISNWFVFNLPDQRDIRTVGFPMGLDGMKMEVIPTLEQRQCVAKTSNLNLPYLIEVKRFDSVDVSEEEREQYRRMSLERLTPMRSLPGSVRTFDRDPKKITPVLSAYKDILDYLTEHPDANQTTIKNDLGFSQWEFTKHTDAMKKREYIKEHIVTFGRRGAPSTFFEVLKPGADYICKKYSPLAGKGDYPHRLIQYLISKQVIGIVEMRGADVGWEKPNGDKIAIEIELECNDHILTNVRRDLAESGFQEVWIVCKNEGERQKIKYVMDTWLDEEDRQKVMVKLFRELL